jgi:tetratricopeptide (TPR) repeat protein
VASRLLARLDAQIAAAGSPVAAACLRARKATYLARQGREAEAAAIVASIREAFGKAPNAEVTAWVSLVESLIQFYGNPGPMALDRLRRADALSRAINHPELVALCAAWLAHMEFNDRQMVPMVAHAAQALRLAQPTHHATLARVSLDIADALHFAGRFDLAKPWYAAVRDHALAEGDDAMISAMLHNSATLRANNVRLADAFGEAQSDQAAQALMEAESTKNFDIGIGTASLTIYVPLIRAQLLTVQGRHGEALALFDNNLDQASEQGMGRMKLTLYADRALCNLRLGLVEQARQDISSALDCESAACDPDDRAIMHAQVARLLRELGDSKSAAAHRKLAEGHLSVHAAAQHELLEQIRQILPAGPVALGAAGVLKSGAP